ncbi:MAG: hypothetical protein A3D26_03355 [Candidatus Blackburnbacteria bacterium RIFCSPHIGHO2_02_FULL_44_20]|uniref:Uncharacterized protein n=1 Tax=Candidatus Blackburnbacteria bacterium RIFCSPHIGHO2_02_FULL_44_20 TaxID=1797516 RepID=A0A1G1V8D6_9BACT|nr:MAG: hypothetical protein A3D26_03355 [Candidatus Blackburnbacteria bacterium RIFCSPHIGHO2_02_FULL_44_20]
MEKITAGVVFGGAGALYLLLWGDSFGLFFGGFFLGAGSVLVGLGLGGWSAKATQSIPPETTEQ